MNHLFRAVPCVNQFAFGIDDSDVPRLPEGNQVGLAWLCDIPDEIRNGHPLRCCLAQITTLGHVTGDIGHIREVDHAFVGSMAYKVHDSLDPGDSQKEGDSAVGAVASDFSERINVVVFHGIFVGCVSVVR